MYRILFYYFSELLDREFENSELHDSLESAKLRASAMGWTIQSYHKVS